jgi:hypothetical protein
MNRNLPLLPLLLLAVPASAQPNIVNNSSFETNNVGTGDFLYQPTASPWSFTAGTGITYSGGAWGRASQDGSYLAFLQTWTPGDAESITQTLNVTPGQTYRLSFYASPRIGFGANQLSVPGTSIAPFVATNNWNLVTGTFTATSSTFDLTFLAESLPSNSGNVDAGTFVDNVSVQAVPEPASMAALGLGALGLLKRRRKG